MLSCLHNIVWWFRSPQENLHSFLSMTETHICSQLAPWSSPDLSALLIWTITNQSLSHVWWGLMYMLGSRSRKHEWDRKFYDMHMKEPAYEVGKGWQYTSLQMWLIKRENYHCSYRIVALTPTIIEVKLVDGIDDPSILVALDRLCPCFSKILNTYWTDYRKIRKRISKRFANNPTVYCQKKVKFLFRSVPPCPYCFALFLLAIMFLFHMYTCTIYNGVISFDIQKMKSQLIH